MIVGNPLARSARRRIARAWRSLVESERGNALAMTAAAFPLLVGSAGLAVDTTQWVVTKRQLQQVADAAALAGSNAAIQGMDVDYAVDRAVHPLYAKVHGLTTQATLSPKDYDGDPYAVGVELASTGSLPFSSMFLKRPLTIAAKATATVVHGGYYCGYALGSSTESGIVLMPGSEVEADCGMATNAGGSNSVTADITAKMIVSKLLSFGGVSGTGFAGTSTRSYGLRQKDPVAKVDIPSVPPTGCPNVTIGSDTRQTVTLKPGCFGNMIIDGPVNLSPGDYVLNRGNLILGTEAQLSCNGCTIFLTSEDAATLPGSVGSVQIDKEASIKLTAPKNGPHAGIAIYQDRRAATDTEDDENQLAGYRDSAIDGLVYLPGQSVTVEGDGSPAFQCARIIGRRLIFKGKVMFARDCGENGKIALTASEVRLVD